MISNGSIYTGRERKLKEKQKHPALLKEQGAF